MDAGHLTPETLNAYARGRLPAAAVLEVSDHLESCPQCREALAGAGRGPEEASLVDDPPTYEELVGWMGDTLSASDRERLAARLRDSPDAKARLADLERFRDDMARLPPQVFRPEGEAIINVAWGRRNSTATWLAAAAVMMILATGSWLFFVQRPQTVRYVVSLPASESSDPVVMPEDLFAAVEKAERGGRIDLPPLPPELQVRGETLAGSSTGADASFHPLAPLTGVIRRTQPVLSWTPRADAAGYVVILQRLSDGQAQTSPELPASQTSWIPPDALEPGAIYEWQVEARRADDHEVLDRTPKPPSPEARFQVLDAAKAAELTEIEHSLTKTMPLVMGTAYARAGLRADAAEQFKLMLRDHPDSAVARRLLAEVEATPTPTSNAK